MRKITWAAELPAEWTHASLRVLADIYAGGTPDRSRLEFWAGGTVPWLNSGSVNNWAIMEPSALITEAAFASSSAQWIPPQSVVVALAGQGKTKGLAARLEFRSTANQSMAAIVPGPKLEYRFLQYWLTSNYQNIRNMAGGDKRDGLNLMHIGSIQCPLPTFTVQQRIANYLDRETGEIDMMIAKMDELRNHLSARRQNSISTAVVQNGVERPFLTCLSRVVDYRGATPVKTDDGIQLITARNVKAGWIDYETSREFVDPRHYAEIMARGKVEIGDLLFTMEAPLGNIALVSRTEIALAQRIVKWTTDTAVILPKFLMYAVLGDTFQAELRIRATGSTALGIKASKFSEIRISCPPVEEQKRIVHHLDEVTSRIDAMLTKVAELKSLLIERRAALITDVVTGRKEVA